MTPRREEPAPNFGVRYMRGLRTSVHTNASAYGFSVTITGSFGTLQTVWGAPGIPDIFAFAGGAVLAFAFVEATASGGFRKKLGDEPSEIKALGSSISFLSVGLGLVVALLAGWLLRGVSVRAWPLGSFLATSVYLLLFALELGLAEEMEMRRQTE